MNYTFDIDHRLLVTNDSTVYRNYRPIFDSLSRYMDRPNVFSLSRRCDLKRWQVRLL
jgi:hypothetical protein